MRFDKVELAIAHATEMASESQVDWCVYHNAAEGWRASPLDAIATTNSVDRLRVVKPKPFKVAFAVCDEQVAPGVPTKFTTIGYADTIDKAVDLYTALSQHPDYRGVGGAVWDLRPVKRLKPV